MCITVVMYGWEHIFSVIGATFSQCSSLTDQYRLPWCLKVSELPSNAPLLFAVTKSPAADVTCSLPRHLSTSKEPNLVVSFPGPKQPSSNRSANSVEGASGLEEKDFSAEEASFSDQPVFFR